MLARPSSQARGEIVDRAGKVPVGPRGDQAFADAVPVHAQGVWYATVSRSGRNSVRSSPRSCSIMTEPSRYRT